MVLVITHILEKDPILTRVGIGERLAWRKILEMLLARVLDECEGT
jgi:hypothetical protein